MPDMEGFREASNYGIGEKAKSDSFFLKGLENADWGVKYRMSRIFNQKSGNPRVHHGPHERP